MIQIKRSGFQVEINLGFRKGDNLSGEFQIIARALFMSREKGFPPDRSPLSRSASIRGSAFRFGAFAVSAFALSSAEYFGAVVVPPKKAEKLTWPPSWYSFSGRIACAHALRSTSFDCTLTSSTGAALDSWVIEPLALISALRNRITAVLISARSGVTDTSPSALAGLPLAFH